MASKKNGNGKNYQDLKCIWMSSHLVDYKLCDRDFDCENCQFDRVMRNKSDNNAVEVIVDENYSPIEEAIKRIKAQAYEPKNIYLKNQLMVKHLFANTFYVGINPIVTTFLDNVTAVKDAGHEGYVLKNQALFRIEGEWGYITITSPMNFILLDKLDFTPEDMLVNKWFAIIGITQPELTTARISREEWQASQISSIKVLTDYKTAYPSIGTTLMDGGLPVRHLNRLLGNNEYLKMLSKLFNE
jgi:hypothetical protein